MVSNDNYDDNNNRADNSDNLGGGGGGGDCGQTMPSMRMTRAGIPGPQFSTTTTTTTTMLDYDPQLASMSIRLKNLPNNKPYGQLLLNGTRSSLPDPTVRSNGVATLSNGHTRLSNGVDHHHLIKQRHLNENTKQSHINRKLSQNVRPCKEVERPHWFIIFTCYFSFFVLISFGYFRNFLQKMFRTSHVFNGSSLSQEKGREGFTPLYKDWQNFFTEHIYRRASDIFAQPITGNPGGVVKVIERISRDYNRTFQHTDKTFDCINLASYDYLGFSQLTDENRHSIQSTIRKYGVGVAPVHMLGVVDKQRELEQKFAQYLGVEDCAVFGMGFATNSTNIPVLVGPGATNCLVISDQYNHASVRSGIYLSGATFRQFKHNNMDHLEQIIRTAILSGNPKQDGQKWNKILIIVEGVYSMEGTIVDLPRLLQLKKQYKCYLYIDEAHSIGAIGPNGRGVCDYFHRDPTEVDLLMGTMTKSFAASGGYIAGSRQMIQYIRSNTHSNYAGSMAAPIAQQIINTLDTLLQEGPQSEGQQRFKALLDNTHHMRTRLKELGFIIVGNSDSPVIPIMVYIPAKVLSIVRMAVRNGLALVCAGYPATALTACRIRLCMTAGHSRETIDRAIEVLSMLGDKHAIKYAK